jgi:hypothetical protein
MNCLRRWIIFNLIIPWEDFWMKYHIRKTLKKCHKILNKISVKGDVK